MNKFYAPSADDTKTHVVSDFVVPILLGGIIAGTLDIGAASLIDSAKPTRIQRPSR
jgi:hypothetical protein